MWNEVQSQYTQPINNFDAKLKMKIVGLLSHYMQYRFE